MTIEELKRMINRAIQEDERDPVSFRPVVAIGHTKDLIDYETVELFLSYLDGNGIRVSSLEDVYTRLKSGLDGT